MPSPSLSYMDRRGLYARVPPPARHAGVFRARALPVAQVAAAQVERR